MTNKLPFVPADILLPCDGFEKWAVVACDQYTSEPGYWKEVEEQVGDAPSTYRMIFPEAYLQDRPDERIENINTTMDLYMADGVFCEYKDALFYTERTQRDGRVLQGIIGAIDLEAYDYNKGSVSPVRATEGTILERIPPRVKIRQDAPLELPHIIILIDDPTHSVIAPVGERKGELKALYDFELMQGGGSAAAWLVDDNNAVLSALAELVDGKSLQFAIGDGNHSLATAKACYTAEPTPQNRYALVQIVNIHDAALDFEPIYRVLFGADYDELMGAARAYFTPDADGHAITVLHGNKREELCVRALNSLPVGTLQIFLDAYLADHPEVEIDYIHGEDTAGRLAKEGGISFLFRGMEKSDLFPAVEKDGSLPRKTFSMGHAYDKRYYIEGRKIR